MKENFVRLLNKRRLAKTANLTPAERTIAFHTPLPPSKTGAGIYALNIYLNILDDLDFVSDFLRTDDYLATLEYALAPYKQHLVPQSLIHLRNYCHHVLNLGNSSFHLPYLLYGIQTKGIPNRHIVLCETQICALIDAYCKRQGINFYKLLRQTYPDKIRNSVLKKGGDWFENLHKAEIYGIRFLIQATGIKHFIVYREIGKEMLLADLKGSDFENTATVSVIPMGFEKIEPYPVKIPLDPDSFNIGSFGIASDIKQTDKVIRAVDLLNRQGIKATLWLVGYGVEKYAQCFKSPNVRTVENTDYSTLLQYMLSVDLAVQLRKYTNGESSGCLSELIALNKNFIAADNLFEPYFKTAGTIVSENCSIEELATLISDELSHSAIRDNAVLINKYTFKNTAKKMKEALL